MPDNKNNSNNNNSNNKPPKPNREHEIFERRDQDCTTRNNDDYKHLKPKK